MKTRTPSLKKSATLELVPFQFKIKKVVVPIDFSTASQRALNFAFPFVDQFGAELILVHVMEDPPYQNFAPLNLEAKRLQGVHRDAAMIKLKKLAPKPSLSSKGKVRTLIKEGKPFEVINQTAKQTHSDLIIMSTHGFTGLKHAMLGSTAERVVRHAQCPVITIRTGG